MRTATETVANKSFSPTSQQQLVLDVFKYEYQVNPRWIRDVTDLERQRINEALGSLEDAGWVEKRTRGLYRLVYDGEGYVEQKIVHRKGENAEA